MYSDVFFLRRNPNQLQEMSPKCKDFWVDVVCVCVVWPFQPSRACVCPGRRTERGLPQTRPGLLRTEAQISRPATKHTDEWGWDTIFILFLAVDFEVKNGLKCLKVEEIFLQNAAVSLIVKACILFEFVISVNARLFCASFYWKTPRFLSTIAVFPAARRCWPQ